MIYFLTDWQSEIEQLESNVVFNVNKVFYEGQIETKIINTRLSPFSNYFTNPFEFYDSNHFVNLLDSMTTDFSVNYAPLTLRDLIFPKDWEKVYTRTSVLLTKDGAIKAEVLFNSFGFVSQVHYYSNFGKETQIYSEKGVLQSKQKLNSCGEQVEQQLFDEVGRLILTQKSDYVFIDDGYKKRFKQSTYQTFKEVCMELVNVALVNFNPKEDRLVIDGKSDWLMELVEGFVFPESIVYIFTGSTQDCMYQANYHLRLIEKGKQMITDNTFFQKSLERNEGYQKIKNATRFMSLYPTTLTLGESNTYLEAYVYWQIEAFDSQVSNTLQEFLRMKLTIRELCLIIDSRKGDEEAIRRLLTNFIVQNFEVSLTSSEYQLVKQYYEALENDELTPGLRELFQVTKQDNPAFGRVIEAYLFYRGITFRKSVNVQDLKEEFQKVRVFIDQRETYEFLSHSLAVSAGIPVFSKIRSPYLEEGKNGIIYKEVKQLVEAVKYYLSDPDQWNQNLVESVEIAENNSAEELLEKWKEILR